MANRMYARVSRATTVILIVAASCGINAALALAQPESMSAYWPNGNGRTWLFAQHYQDFVFEPSVVDNSARYTFNGTTTAPIGISAQLWELTILGPTGRAASSRDDSSLRAAMRVPESIVDPFLRNLWMARPDLRGRIQERIVVDHSCP